MTGLLFYLIFQLQNWKKLQKKKEKEMPIEVVTQK